MFKKIFKSISVDIDAIRLDDNNNPFKQQMNIILDTEYEDYQEVILDKLQFNDMSYIHVIVKSVDVKTTTFQMDEETFFKYAEIVKEDKGE